MGGGREAFAEAQGIPCRQKVPPKVAGTLWPPFGGRYRDVEESTSDAPQRKRFHCEMATPCRRLQVNQPIVASFLDTPTFCL